MNDIDLFHEPDILLSLLMESVSKYATQVDLIYLSRQKVPLNGVSSLLYIPLEKRWTVHIVGKQVDLVLVMQLADQAIDIKSSHVRDTMVIL